MFNDLWNSLAFWQILFITVIISLVIIKILSFLETKFGVFKQYRVHDLETFKNLSEILSEEDLISFLNDLEKDNQCKKQILQKIMSLKSAILNSENRYKSELLRSKIDALIENLETINTFIVNNFYEKGDILTLSPKANDANNKNYSIGADKQEKDLLGQKEILKQLINKNKEIYSSYRAIIKSYLHV